MSAVAARLNEQSGHIIIKDPTNNGIPDDPPDFQLDDNVVKSVARSLTQVEKNLLYVKIGSIYHSWKAIDDSIEVWSSYGEDKRGKYLCLVCQPVLLENVPAPVPRGVDAFFILYFGVF